MTISSSTTYLLGGESRARLRQMLEQMTDYAMIEVCSAKMNNGHFTRRGAASVGRVIWQVVGRMVCAVSIFATSFQPQPVFSSSNGSLLVNSPNDAMYIGWKNWWSSFLIKPVPPP